MSLILNPNFTSTTTTATGDALVAVGTAKAFVKIAGNYNGASFAVDEILDITDYNDSNSSYQLTKKDGSGGFYWRVLGDSSWGLVATLDDWTITQGVLSQTELANGKFKGDASSSVALIASQDITLLEDEKYTIASTSTNYRIDFIDEAVERDSDNVTQKFFQGQRTGFTFTTSTLLPTQITIRVVDSHEISSFQITQKTKPMAITKDGTHKFGIEYSPITIDAKTYIAESMSFNSTASRVDIDDSNGEPVGSTIVPGRIEGSTTLQLQGTDTAPARGDEFTLASGDNDGVYVIQDVSEAQSQGDYTKVSVNFYKKINV